jgi:pimeloyl-ACP methyl ester carboxylesterase
MSKEVIEMHEVNVSRWGGAALTLGAPTFILRAMTDGRKSSRAIRGVVAGAGLCAALAGAGAAYQSVAAARDRRRYPPPGRLVDAGSHRLHLNVTGECYPGPTVVLEAGGTTFSSQWARVQPGISEFARVVSYDRAGLGWSEAGPKPRDAYTIARELYTALENAGLPKPYVAVGSSLGGPYALAFAGLYPDEVAGVVLVDSSHPDQWERFPARVMRFMRVYDRVARALHVPARFGLLRLFDVSKKVWVEPGNRLTPEAQAHFGMFYASPGHWRATRDEVSLWYESMAQVRAVWNLGDRPLAVLTAPVFPVRAEAREYHLQMQRELAVLSRNATHRFLEGASHVATMTDPEVAREVVEGVHEIVREVQALQNKVAR